MSIDLLTIEPDEAQDIFAMQQAFGVIGKLFVEGEGTPQALRMVIAQLRTSATVLEAITQRWEASIDGEGEGRADAR
jgi:uncharacterized protein YoaH (UPF0181 family)